MALQNWTNKGLKTIFKNSGGKTTDQSNASQQQIFFSSYRVRDIVLDKDFKDPNSENDPSHDFEYFGGWNGIGTIIIEPVDDGGVTNERPPIDFAIPFFPNIKHYPLKNEIVWVIQLADADAGANISQTTNYYLPPINIWNSQLHNAIPYIPPDGVSSATLPNYQAIESGSSGGVRRVDDEGTDIDLGSTFNESNAIDKHPLLPYEGDIIYEGRFSNSLRFGSTVSEAIHANNWSSEGYDGDPITILRNGQSYNQFGVDGTTDPWVPCVENINEDQSSIYLTSTQQVPLNLISDIPSSYDLTGLKETPVTPTQFAGNQILLSSGRLVFNAKNDHILLSSDKSIHLSSNTSINLDTGDQIVLNTDNAKGKITLISDKIYLGLSESPGAEGYPGAALQSLVLGEDLVQVLNSIYLMLRKIQEAMKNSNIPSDIGNLSDASLVNAAAGLSTQIKSFKKLIGEPKSSPLLSKTTKTYR
jgi:hypothetical protein